MSTNGSLVWPPALEDEQILELTHLAATYALSNGLAYLPINSQHHTTPTGAIHGPYTLFPSPFPRSLFSLAQKLQRSYSVLYSRIALDEGFLDRVMGRVEGVGKVDEFVGTLWDGWKKLRDEDGGIIQPLHLGLYRSDYMLHSVPSGCPSQNWMIKQVEFNTISASFGSLSAKTASLHRYLLASTDYYGKSPLLKATNFPPNETPQQLVLGLAEAHKAYDRVNSAILFVIQPGERNVFDQRWLEYELLEKHGIVVIRRTFTELAHQAHVDQASRVLTVKMSTRTAPVEISVVYYRAGYMPTEYPTSTEFDTRFKLERSLAVKCPTIALQLAGGKKVQQVLAEEGVLEYFLQNPDKWGTQYVFSDESLAEIRATWMDMWGLDAIKGVENAQERAEHLVLKPQREGGGNNIYRDNIPAFLDNLPEREREAWIAMELIQAPVGLRNLMTKAGEANPVEIDMVNELGTFGWSLFAKNKDIRESEAGWLVRTKGRDSDEGGVAVGFSVLDSIVFV